MIVNDEGSSAVFAFLCQLGHTDVYFVIITFVLNFEKSIWNNSVITVKSLQTLFSDEIFGNIFRVVYHSVNRNVFTLTAHRINLSKVEYIRGLSFNW